MVVLPPTGLYTAFVVGLITPVEGALADSLIYANDFRRPKLYRDD